MAEGHGSGPSERLEAVEQRGKGLSEDSRYIFGESQSSSGVKAETRYARPDARSEHGVKIDLDSSSERV